jgi:hypothetical protein
MLEETPVAAPFKITAMKEPSNEVLIVNTWPKSAQKGPTENLFWINLIIRMNI